jgi:SAM-dependent methyltransferase
LALFSQLRIGKNIFQLSDYENWVDEPFAACENPEVPMGRWLLQHLPAKPTRLLDVGCGKGFLLYEMQLIEPGIEFHGFDISHGVHRNQLLAFEFRVF